MDDKYAGMGGSYVVNEKGERALVERTREAGEVANDQIQPVNQQNALANQEQPAAEQPGADI